MNQRNSLESDCSDSRAYFRSTTTTCPLIVFSSIPTFSEYMSVYTTNNSQLPPPAYNGPVSQNRGNRSGRVQRFFDGTSNGNSQRGQSNVTQRPQIPPPDLSNLDPTVSDWLAQLKESHPPPIYSLKPADARQVLEDLQKQHGRGLHGVRVESRFVPGLNGNVPIDIYWPAPDSSAWQKTRGPLPVILYLHGGGWILGSAQTHDRLLRDLVKATGYAIVFPKYSAAPERQYPYQLEQVWDVAQWISHEGPRAGLDPNAMAIAGDSAGGNLAIATALRSVADRLPPPVPAGKGPKGPNGQRMPPPPPPRQPPVDPMAPRFKFMMLFYPVTDASMQSPTYEQYANGPWLTARAMDWFWNAYYPDPQARVNDPYASPVVVGPDWLSLLPPTLVVLAEHDVLRAEGEEFADHLQQAGVPIRVMVVPGTIHDFVMLNPLSGTDATISTIRQVAGDLRRYLGQQRSGQARRPQSPQSQMMMMGDGDMDMDLGMPEEGNFFMGPGTM